MRADPSLPLRQSLLLVPLLRGRLLPRLPLFTFLTRWFVKMFKCKFILCRCGLRDMQAAARKFHRELILTIATCCMESDGRKVDSRVKVRRCHVHGSQSLMIRFA